jgi:uncharacterized protein (DUF433 family)
MPATLSGKGGTSKPPGNAIEGDLAARYDSLMDYKSRITLEPGKRGGKPCIRGLRITVYDVLDYMASGMAPEQIVDDFPELEIDDVRACLAFAADRERRLVIGNP